jgi:hypothetical protein
MTSTRTRLRAVSIASAVAAGWLVLTACGNTEATTTATQGGPVTVTSIDGR